MTRHRFHRPNCVNPFNRGDKDIRDLQIAYANRHDTSGMLSGKAPSPRTVGIPACNNPHPHRPASKWTYPLAHVSILDREEEK